MCLFVFSLKTRTEWTYLLRKRNLSPPFRHKSQHRQTCTDCTNVLVRPQNTKARYSIGGVGVCFFACPCTAETRIGLRRGCTESSVSCNPNKSHTQSIACRRPNDIAMNMHFQRETLRFFFCLYTHVAPRAHLIRLVRLGRAPWPLVWSARSTLSNA